MAHQALFAGLVYDEREIPLETVYIGSDAFYVVDDNGFRRHVEADEIDRRVLTIFLQHLEDNKDMAVEQALRLIGKDDLSIIGRKKCIVLGNQSYLKQKKLFLSPCFLAKDL